MNITVDYIRGGELENFKVMPIDFRMYTNDESMYCTNVNVDSHGSISFDVRMPRTKVFFDVSCYDADIFHCPILITGIHFDNFYHLKTFVHHALPIPAEDNVHQVDIVPGNCLFFCGVLQYVWQGPTPQIVIPAQFRWGDPQ